ncbi:MAG: PAS domain S-box protein [Desulfobacteraceae bacterium]|nr:PAS domain S-box protein [Desulfobacteraceae bacterium]
MRNIVDTLTEEMKDLAAITDSSGNLLYLNRLDDRIPGFKKDDPADDYQLFRGTTDNWPKFNRVIVHKNTEGKIACFSFHLPPAPGKNGHNTRRQPDAEKLRALIDASKTIFEADSVEKLLKHTLESACRLTGCRVSAFCEIPEVPGNCFPVRKYCISDKLPAGQEEPAIMHAANMLKYAPFLQTIENQQVVNFLETAPVSTTETTKPAAGKNTSCTMIFALVPGRHSQTRGVILARDPEKGEFSGEEEALMGELASFASLGLGHFQFQRHHLSLEMEQIFSALAEPVIVYDKTGNPVMANSAAINMLGFDPVGIPHETFVQKKALLYPNGRPVPFKLLPCQRAIAGNRIRGEVYLRKDVKGTERLYEINAGPLIRNNRIAGAVTVARDETERNRLMNQLETERTALQAVINNAPEAIVVVDSECRVVMTNPAAKRLYQHSPAWNQGWDAEPSPQETPYDPVDLPLARSVFKGEMIVDHELTTLLTDSAPRHILVNTAPIRNPDGEITGAVGVFHDITQRKRERIELRQARDELEKRVEERTAELRNLSHRMLDTLESDRQKIAKELHDSLGASLAAIKFSLEEKLAQMPPDPPDRVMSLEDIVSYLTGTIKETKRISATLRPTILDDLGLLATITWFCREFNAFYHDILIIERIKIREEVIEEPLKIVIYRIMQEAMNNAAKHSQPETIWLYLQKNGDRVKLEVTDDGCGFDPKTRLNPTDPMSGHGIQGMRERASVCGGEFEIHSAPGAGTRVSVSFPHPYCAEKISSA